MAAFMKITERLGNTLISCVIMMYCEVYRFPQYGEHESQYLIIAAFMKITDFARVRLYSYPLRYRAYSATIILLVLIKLAFAWVAYSCLFISYTICLFISYTTSITSISFLNFFTS